MTPREKAAEALDARGGPMWRITDYGMRIVERIEAAGLLIVDPAAGTDALLAAVFAADDGAVPATAGDPLPGTSGGGLVGPAAPEGDPVPFTLAPDEPTPIAGDRVDSDGFVWRQDPVGCWHMVTTTAEYGECADYCGASLKRVAVVHGELRPVSDHPTRAQVFTDDELEQGAAQ